MESSASRMRGVRGSKVWRETPHASGTRARQLSRCPWRCAKKSHKCGRDANPYTLCISSRSLLSRLRHSPHSQLPHSVCLKLCLHRHRFLHRHRRYCYRIRHQESASVCMCAFCVHHGRPHSSFHSVPWSAVAAPFHTCAFGGRLHTLRSRSPPSPAVDRYLLLLLNGQQQVPSR